MPVRAIYCRALRRGEITTNPTTDLEMPAPVRRPRRIASPETAADLLLFGLKLATLVNEPLAEQPLA